MVDDFAQTNDESESDDVSSGSTTSRSSQRGDAAVDAGATNDDDDMFGGTTTAQTQQDDDDDMFGDQFVAGSVDAHQIARSRRREKNALKAFEMKKFVSCTLDDNDRVDADDEIDDKQRRTSSTASTTTATAAVVADAANGAEISTVAAMPPTEVEPPLLAQWEVFTRGVGSRLLEMMGWRLGEGLGVQKQGRAEPVVIDATPDGQPIDEDKHYGIGHAKRTGAHEVSRRRRRRRNNESERSAKRAKKSLNVFEFLNKSLATGTDGDVAEHGATSATPEKKSVTALSMSELNAKIDHLQKKRDKLTSTAAWLAQSATRNKRRDAAMAAKAATRHTESLALIASINQQLDVLKRAVGQKSSGAQIAKLTTTKKVF